MIAAALIALAILSPASGDDEPFPTPEPSDDLVIILPVEPYGPVEPDPYALECEEGEEAWPTEGGYVCGPADLANPGSPEPADLANPGSPEPDVLAHTGPAEDFAALALVVAMLMIVAGIIARLSRPGR